MDQFRINFQIDARAEYLDILKAAFRVLVPFATSYVWKAGFSAVTVLKQNLARNWMSI